MTKHPPADDSEATMAALAYMPGLAPLIYLSLETGKPQYFIRYHIAHALLLNTISFVALVIVACLGFIPEAPAWIYLVMGVGISLVLIVSTVVHTLAAVQAYRSRLIVLPGITQLYYRFFAKG
ncbi:MAG: hypothetical protein H7338_18060 [Candidatus Sericytochromatia bacterium]|nr:hypothetical protein [Candidatus Sericytochromatia bacterium]